MIEHHYTMERKLKSERQVSGPPRVFLTYRWSCSCGFKTKYSKTIDKATDYRDKHALEGQLSIPIP